MVCILAGLWGSALGIGLERGLLILVTGAALCGRNLARHLQWLFPVIGTVRKIAEQLPVIRALRQHDRIRLEFGHLLCEYQLLRSQI